MKTVSIIMPVYNTEQYISEAIESILAQTYTDFELIIIDDQSTDRSKKIALDWSLRDKRIQVVDNTYTKGLYGALNTGLTYATGHYIARADADDINVIDRLEQQVAYLESHPDIAIIGGRYLCFNNKDPERVHTHPSNSLILEWKFLSNTYFCHPSVMFRRCILEKIPSYPPVVCEDFAFFSEIIHSYKGTNLPSILINYRIHDNNYSVTKREAIEGSVKETYMKNFAYYTGNQKDAELFYKFHANRDLSLGHLGKVYLICFKIIKTMLSSGKKFSRWERITLYFNILFSIKISVILHYLRPLYRFMKR